MAAQLFFLPFDPVFTSRGLPAGAAKAYFYAAGTTTPAPVYSDAALSNRLPNPVPADALGRLPNIYLDEAITYRVLITDARGGPIGDQIDPYIPGRAGEDGPKGDPGGNTSDIGTFLIAKTGTLTPPAGTTTLRTSGYKTPGDGGAATYYASVTDNAAIPSSAKFQAGGKWWFYAVQGPGQIEQFGEACDCPYASFDYISAGFTASYAIPGGVTDNLQPLLDAINVVGGSAVISARNEVGSLIPIEFVRTISTATSYAFSGPIVPTCAIYIRGTNQGGDSIKTGTTFRFPPDVQGLLLNARTGQPGYPTDGSQPNPPLVGAGNSRIEGIWFQGGGGTNRAAHGLEHHVSAFIRNCVFDSFAGHNIYNIGYTGVAVTDRKFGLTSGSSYENVTCRAAGMWNTWIEGSDVSASVTYNLHHKGSRLGGLGDLGYFGNLHLGYQNNQHGDGKLGAVTYGGRHYQLSANTTAGGTTTPGTNDQIWEDIGLGTANVYYPTWASGGTYVMSVPTFVATAATEIIGYIENYYLYNVGGRISGTMHPGRYTIAESAQGSPGGLTLVSTPFGSRLSVPASDVNYATLGDTVDISMGRDSGNRNVIFRWQTTSHGEWSTAFEGANIRFGIGTPGTGSRPANYYLGQSTTTTLGRVAAADARGFNVAVNFALGIESNPSTARVHVSYSGAIPHKYFDANGVQQNRPRGEVLFNIDPTIGGALIYTAMGDGTSQPVGIVGAVRATGLSSSSTAAQIVAALQAAGLAV